MREIFEYDHGNFCSYKKPFLTLYLIESLATRRLPVPGDSDAATTDRSLQGVLA